MNTIQRIIKNTASLFVAQIIVSILSLILSIFIARFLGETLFGKYSFAIAFVAIFTLYSDLGYNTLMLREIARNNENAKKYLQNVLAIRIVVCSILFSLILISINLLEYPQDTKNVVYILAGAALISSVTDVFSIIFRAFEKMEYEALTKTLFNLIRVSLGIIILFIGYGLIELSLVFLFSSLFNFTLSFVLCKKKFVNPMIEFDLTFLKNTLKIAIPLGTLSFFGIIYTRIDTVMISLIQGDAPVGWYNAAYNLILGLKPIPKLFISVLLPLMYNYSTSSKRALNYLFEKSFKMLYCAGLFFVIVTCSFATDIITIAYGESYYNSIIALQVLSLDILLIFLINPLGGVLISTNCEKSMNFVYIFTVICNIGLNLILIPAYSYIGAAFATIICELLLITIYIYIVLKNGHKLPLRKIMIKPIITSLAVGILINVLDSINILLRFLIAALLYVGLLYCMDYFSQDEKDIISQALKTKCS